MTTATTSSDSSKTGQEAQSQEEREPTPEKAKPTPLQSALAIDYKKLQPRLANNASPADMAAELLRLGQMLSYYEYQSSHQIADYDRHKNQYDTSLLLATSRMEGKLTETAKKAQALDSDPALGKMRVAMVDADVMATQLRGIRDALRTSYETVSRIVTIKQLEIELTRSAG